MLHNFSQRRRSADQFFRRGPAACPRDPEISRYHFCCWMPRIKRGTTAERESVARRGGKGIPHIKRGTTAVGGRMMQQAGQAAARRQWMV
ncbi:MAG: hypothetical protein SFW66_09130 [Gammaproteobacteria bacterium]|nr:hypothetical protein [Gammaproteobacteria bacterium]